VVLTSNVNSLNPSLAAAKDLSTEDGVNFGEFKVIICGKTITDWQKRNHYHIWKWQKKNNVKIVACGFS
jgi:hypothetical protein